MRWLLLFAVAVLVAVGLWVLLPDAPEVKAAAGVAERVRRDVRGEPPPEHEVILEHTEAPRSQAVEAAAPPIADAGVTVHAIFEQYDAHGRVAGTRFNLQWDGGEVFTGLADAMGIAHVEVPEGNWVVECSNDCGAIPLTIAPGYDHFILPVVQHFAVTGVVEDLSGNPVAAADIDTPEDYHRLAVSRSDGSFSFATTSRSLLLTATHEGESSVPSAVSVPLDKPVKLVIRPWASVRFSFPGFPSDTVQMTSLVSGQRMDYSIDEGRQLRLPVGIHEAIARTWRGHKTWSAKANFGVYRDKRLNRVEIVLSEEPGLRVRVTDGSGQPMAGVEVNVFHATRDLGNPDGGCAVVKTYDGGLYCAALLEREATRGLTDGNGQYEVTPPESEADPLFRISLSGLWREQHATLMRLGDEPATIVAVPH